MATAEAFDAVGTATGFHAVDGVPGGWDYATTHVADFAFNVAGHALVGCASSAASGGTCESGVASGGFGAFAAPATQSLPGDLSFAATTVSGGLGSVLGGGKFENGAVTAAFGYLYNDAASEAQAAAWMGGSSTGGLGLSALQEFNAAFDALYQKATIYFGYTGEVTEVFGGAGTVGGLINTDGEFGAFASGGVTGGENNGASGVVGVNFGGVSLFRGSSSQLNISYIGGVSANFATDNGAPTYLSGFSVQFSGKLGASYSPNTVTCVFTNKQSGC